MEVFGIVEVRSQVQAKTVVHEVKLRANFIRPEGFLIEGLRDRHSAAAEALITACAEPFTDGGIQEDTIVYSVLKPKLWCEGRVAGVICKRRIFDTSNGFVFICVPRTDGYGQLICHVVGGFTVGRVTRRGDGVVCGRQWKVKEEIVEGLSAVFGEVIGADNPVKPITISVELEFLRELILVDLAGAFKHTAKHARCKLCPTAQIKSPAVIKVRVGADGFKSDATKVVSEAEATADLLGIPEGIHGALCHEVIAGDRLQSGAVNGSGDKAIVFSVAIVRG